MLIFISKLRDILWGPPLIILLLGTGIYLTLLLRFIQFRMLLFSFKLALVERREKERAEGDITHFQALMTALSATVGTGNIAGVATAIATGGPGAMFWMWMTGLVGMATKFSEAILAVKFRVKDRFGTMSGGPMYYISKGMGQHWLGVIFAASASLAAFGIGNLVQSNSIAEVASSSWHLSPYIVGTILSLFTGLVVLGGIRSIARTAEVLVPFMIILYIFSGLFVIFMNIEHLPDALKLIFKHAFTPTAERGGFAGASVMLTIRFGIARGLFSNESGLGSSPIAAAAAVTKNPFRQALVSMTQTFIDTLIVCSITGLAIITSGKWTSGLTGANLTSSAFASSLSSSGPHIVALSLLLFAYSTILGWCYYGEKCVEFLLGESAVKPYRFMWTLMVFIGAIMKLEFVWTLSDMMNAIMALPNLVALIFLSNVVRSETEIGIKEEVKRWR